jgi:hypothetical protein
MYTSFYRPFVETCKSLKWKWSIYCTSGWLDALISHQTAGWSNRARGTLRSWQSSTGGVGGRTRPLTRHVRWSMGDPSLCPRRQFQVRKKQCTADPRNNGDDDDDDDDVLHEHAYACILGPLLLRDLTKGHTMGGLWSRGIGQGSSMIMMCARLGPSVRPACRLVR